METVRRIALSPIPRVSDYKELQAIITSKCLEYCETHRVKGRKLNVQEALGMERAELLPLPAVAFDVAKTMQAQVRTDCTIRFEGNRYSVPYALVGETVTIRATPFVVLAYHKGQQVACHERSYEKDVPRYDPEHYLKLLERKPRAIRDALPLKKGVWPRELQEFQARYRGKNLNAQLVEILQLGRNVPKEALLWAINMANQTMNPTLHLIRFYADLHLDKTDQEIKSPVKVEKVDLAEYDRLMRGCGANVGSEQT